MGSVQVVAHKSLFSQYCSWIGFMFVQIAKRGRCHGRSLLFQVILCLIYHRNNSITVQSKKSFSGQTSHYSDRFLEIFLNVWKAQFIRRFYLRILDLTLFHMGSKSFVLRGIPSNLISQLLCNPQSLDLVYLDNRARPFQNCKIIM